MNTVLKPTVEFNIEARLTESEARVLELISQFSNIDVANALGVLTRELGPCGDNYPLASLLNSVRSQVRPQIAIINRARNAMNRELSQ